MAKKNNNENFNVEHNSLYDATLNADENGVMSAFAIGLMNYYVYNDEIDDDDSNISNGIYVLKKSFESWIIAAQRAQAAGIDMPDECIAFMGLLRDEIANSRLYTDDVRKLFDTFDATAKARADNSITARRSGLVTVNNTVFVKDLLQKTTKRQREHAKRAVRLSEIVDDYTVLHDAIVNRIFDFWQDGQISDNGEYVVFSATQLYYALRGNSKKRENGGISDSEKKRIDELMQQLEKRVSISITADFQDVFENKIEIEEGKPRLLNYTPFYGKINGVRDMLYAVRVDSVALQMIRINGSIDAVDEKLLAIKYRKFDDKGHLVWCPYKLTEKRLAAVYSLLLAITERIRMKKAGQKTHNLFSYDDIFEDVEKVKRDKNEIRAKAVSKDVVNTILDYWAYVGVIEKWCTKTTKRGIEDFEIQFKRRSAAGEPQLESGEK